MKRVILLCMILFMSGCSVKVLNEDNDSIINTIKNSKMNYYNKIGLGYKYYLPKGMRELENISCNEVLYSNSNNYYLYIDIVSYYYKTKQKYIVSNNSYYSKKLDKGYIEINPVNNKYLINFYYNYASIEAKVSINDINEVVRNMSYILFNIKYNDEVIDILKNNESFKTNEKLFKLEQPIAKKNNSYLNYKNDGTKVESELDAIVDTDIIKIIED